MPHYFALIDWFAREHRFWGLDWSCLTLLGLLGNCIFSSRFIVQWIASERQKQSVIPVSFWHLSIAGSVVLCLYFIFRRDPVGILATLPNSLIYLRNLHLIRQAVPAIKQPAIADSPAPASQRIQPEP